MNIGYFSDLHTEFLEPDALHGTKRGYGRETFARMLGEAYQPADVVVAAGDIGVGVEAIQFLKLAFSEKPVLALPGNHEHYTHEIHSNLANMAAEAAGIVLGCGASIPRC
jgi:3',5'-cyclic AMP phosphodiesterase CpdA